MTPVIELSGEAIKTNTAEAAPIAAGRGSPARSLNSIEIETTDKHFNLRHLRLTINGNRQALFCYP